MSEEKKLTAIEAAELDLKILEIEHKKLELLDLRDRVDERKMKRENRTSSSRANGRTLQQVIAGDRAKQANCNHKKGGNGAEGVVGGQGDDPQYSVIKHKMPNGDIWVRCLRCAKTWKPPVEFKFYFDSTGKNVAPKDGKFSKEAFDIAVKEYREALVFQTRNQTSGSIVFQFSDGGKHYREKTANANLR